ncbi:MAG: segregation/condensation protein A [Armatimonadetes bacterium]|nr:segregation/condensation protein A [Armatimonadota bacterium]
MAVASPALPPVAVAAFEGPLDLLLHLIREHKIEITDIPIALVTDRYLAWLRAMEEMNLTVAGEFLVMAATLLEIKSRTLLPKPPREEVPEDEAGEDPRRELVQRLLDYQRYRAFTDTLAGWEDDRRRLFFRESASLDLYALPVAFGELNPRALLKALTRLLAEAGADGAEAVTSVRRRKLTLRLAMVALGRRVEAAGPDGLAFDECFARPLVRADIVMTFLALLELLRQGRLRAEQRDMLGEIWLTASPISAETATE